MNAIRFILKLTIDVDGAADRLAASGCDVLFTSEDGKTKQAEIVANVPLCLHPAELQKQFPFITSWEPFDLSFIDWEAQWQTHGRYFQDGLLQLPLKELGGLKDIFLKLRPGAGFGDLSHPTTRLMLKLSLPHVEGKTLLDIGCGSGILSCAAAASGAAFLYGIDIDKQAITHSQDNSKLNGLQEKTWFGRSEELLIQHLPPSFIALMNMISSEQKIAKQSVNKLFPSIHQWITSGILKEEGPDYVARWEKEHWTLVESEEEEGWLAFSFIKN